MSEKRTQDAASPPSPSPDFGDGPRVVDRLKNAIIAGIIALIMIPPLLLEPVDQFFWLIQSRIAGQQPSGDIVFVGTDRDMTDPANPQRRKEVAEALRELDRRGVGKVYLNLRFDELSGTPNDEALATAIDSLGRRVVIVDELTFLPGDRVKVERSVPFLMGSARHVINSRNPNYFGYSWKMPFRHKIDGISYPSLGADMAGVSSESDDAFQIDYGIPFHTIEAYNIAEIAPEKKSSATVDLAGKTVVIGRSHEIVAAREAIPGQLDVPESYVAIYAAESLKAGRVARINGYQATALFMAMLIICIALMKTRKRRRFGYAAIVAAGPIALFAAAKLGIRIEISYAFALLTIYGIIRSRARWKKRVALIDQETGLPTLRALETLITGEGSVRGHVVIAKIHGYEHVLKTLRAEDQSAYILKLVDRLRAADKNLTIYFDNHYLGWHSGTVDTEALCEHLEGLRAIFAAPVNVNGTSIDVGITFGVANLEGGRLRRIPAAIAAAEETSEAHQPIKVADTGSQHDHLWDISLRARIDEAMEAGEIYCVYQPKIDIRTHEVVGVEALVRWHDPAKGFISPMHFIQQCEKAGRMEHLTRYVLQSACSAGQLLHFRGSPITMAVNISATLLGDMRIVGLVRNVLQATGFDPNYLVLEVTETSSISDLSTAASILGELKKLGARISMDDFGVGSANFETFYGLPFDEIKIDRLFIANIARDPKARAIASSVVAMGNQARITVVAEGVEEAEDLEILNKIGCSQVQGFALSRPISLSNLLEFKDYPLKSSEEARQKI